MHEAFPFDFVIMVGGQPLRPRAAVDYANKFELPYAKLLDAGVEFYASSATTTIPNHAFYEPFPHERRALLQLHQGDVKFFALDSNYMDEEH